MSINRLVWIMHYLSLIAINICGFKFIICFLGAPFCLCHRMFFLLKYSNESLHRIVFWCPLTIRQYRVANSTVYSDKWASTILSINFFYTILWIENATGVSVSSFGYNYSLVGRNERQQVRAFLSWLALCPLYWQNGNDWTRVMPESRALLVPLLLVDNVAILRAGPHRPVRRHGFSGAFSGALFVCGNLIGRTFAWSHEVEWDSSLVHAPLAH